MYAHVLFYGRSVRGQPLRQYFHPLQAGRGMGLLMDVDGSSCASFSFGMRSNIFSHGSFKTIC